MHTIAFMCNPPFQFDQVILSIVFITKYLESVRNLTIAMWTSCRTVSYMQNNFRITRLRCLETCAKTRYRTLDTKQTNSTISSQTTQIARASLIVLRKRGQRKRSGSHQNTFIPPNMGYTQADSRARFSHCSTLTPFIKSHKGNSTSPQNVNRLIFAP